MERAAMKVVAGISVLLAILAFYFTTLFALENEWQGKAEGQRFSINYKQDEKSISIHEGDKHEKIPLSGYAVKELHVKDIDFDGNDEVFFLDITGESVGGELRLFYWINGKVAEINEEYYANKITLKQLNRKIYILLWQHDTENLLFCSEVLFMRQGKLLSEHSQKVWDEIIKSYNQSVASEKSKWRKSRYYTYIAMAYQKVGNKTKADQYMTKAKILDPKNPFAK